MAPAIRRLVSKSTDIDTEGGPSPDGRLVTQTDWSTGDLAVRDFAGDTIRRLTSKGSWEASEEFAQASSISPDGKSVVFGWYSSKTNNFELRIMPINGADSGKVRTLHASPEMAYVAPQSWTPDSRNVVAVVYQQDQT
ncbi:MAG: hypothetical protein M3Q50_14870, partial [Chloroflexota bacterium]|nr:hypothetical protein [Chloroflexota bacterium]